MFQWKLIINSRSVNNGVRDMLVRLELDRVLARLGVGGSRYSLIIPCYINGLVANDQWLYPIVSLPFCLAVSWICMDLHESRSRFTKILFSSKDFIAHLCSCSVMQTSKLGNEYAGKDVDILTLDINSDNPLIYTDTSWYRKSRSILLKRGNSFH